MSSSNYIPAYTTQFKKDLGALEKGNKDIKKLAEAMDMLLSGKSLPARFHPTKMGENFKSHMECKIEPDWILIYKLEGREVIFERTGTSYELYN